jgi:hypothetical protein
MNKDISTIVAAVSVVIAVVSIGSAMKQSGQRKTAQAELAALQEQISLMDALGSSADLPAQLRYTDDNTNEVEALQEMLDEREAELAALQTDTATPTNATPPQRESWEERMARMKEEDPEGYAEMIRRRGEWQQKMRYNLAERTATFMDLDTTRMNEKELANHELLVEKMARIWELSEQFQDPEAAPDREAMRELFGEVRDVRPLMDQERTIMFKQLGTDLGYGNKDAKDFARHVEAIIDSTTIQMPRGGGRGGRGGGGR